LEGMDTATRFYLLWRWTYNHARVPFDEARKLAMGVGLELTELWAPGGLVQKDKEYVLVRSPQERAKDPQFAYKDGKFGSSTDSSRPTMIDALHGAVVLWEQNRQRELQEHLGLTYGDDELFWQVAQAISEVLPPGDKEKQLLQGLLNARRTYITQATLPLNDPSE
ncbi:MAG: hypothetical protein SNJ72_08940, partial [Fimbriimonadales bacterium]